VEADLVAHCGIDIEGGYLYTLTLTDVPPGGPNASPSCIEARRRSWLPSNGHARSFPFQCWGSIPITVGSSSMKC
jgi:hypothetical protein